MVRGSERREGPLFLGTNKCVPSLTRPLFRRARPPVAWAPPVFVESVAAAPSAVARAAKGGRGEAALGAETEEGEREQRTFFYRLSREKQNSQTHIPSGARARPLAARERTRRGRSLARPRRVAGRAEQLGARSLVKRARQKPKKKLETRACRWSRIFPVARLTFLLLWVVFDQERLRDCS